MSLDYILYLSSKIDQISKPGLSAQLKMAPSHRMASERVFTHVPKSAKKAAVMMLLYPNAANELMFCLIQRTTYDGKHSGQISFPGGKQEQEDCDFWATALRETEEEIGVSRSSVRLLTSLSSTYIPPSNFQVYPYLAYVVNQPNFVPEKGEVAAIIEVKLDALLAKDALKKGLMSASYMEDVTVPMFIFNGHKVWGATAMILSETRELILSLPDFRSVTKD